ncbi:F-box protein At5g65850 [Sorghum bicolor]|uniref:F-box protein At5g65850 n=1 Tax=Sorghum bicolor TaxID=4558 RepID=UPI0001A873C7|nr:F-box protein At5g65850 [Sorghum bicolor]|eukprot:XP_002448421.1 F-box protein At5g65850 [Sorghum bicolor]
MGDPQTIFEDRREIPTDIIPNILLRLPSKDFVRSSCVCKQWRNIVADPSVRKLHVGHRHAATASSETEVLLVTETRKLGWSDEASVFNLSSAKALCQVAIPTGYRIAGVCNDLLCFVYDHELAPTIVCNPITGEMLRLPKAPPLPSGNPLLSHLFVLGFSRPTKEYKMFQLSFPRRHEYPRDETNYIAVYTLGGGGGGGWRQYSYLSRFHPVTSPAPVHIDGNIFVPTADLADKRARAARMLVLDVRTEAPRLYRIPYNYDDYHEDWDQMLAGSFDLNGQMCLAVNVGFFNPVSRMKTQFWVMKPQGELDQGKDEQEDDDKLHWDLRYSFYFDHFAINAPRAAWIDHTQTLCCRIGTFVYKYDTRGYSSSSNVVDSLLFDERVAVPCSPCPSVSSKWPQFSRWSICGGYRPSLLSPLVFALPPSSQDEEGKKRSQLEQTLIRALEGGA